MTTALTSKLSAGRTISILSRGSAARAASLPKRPRHSPLRPSTTPHGCECVGEPDEGVRWLATLQTRVRPPEPPQRHFVFRDVWLNDRELPIADGPHRFGVPIREGLRHAPPTRMSSTWERDGKEPASPDASSRCPAPDPGADSPGILLKFSRHERSSADGRRRSAGLAGHIRLQRAWHELQMVLPHLSSMHRTSVIGYASTLVGEEIAWSTLVNGATPLAPTARGRSIRGRGFAAITPRREHSRN